MRDMDNSHIFRPIVTQVPGQPDPTSGDGADFAAWLIGPDPRVTGPCQLQASPFCTGEGIQRLDPMDMLDASTAFARHVSACLDCYEARADRYVMEVHAR